MRGLIGFHRIPGPEPKVSLTRTPATLGEMLDEYFLKDPRYKLVPMDVWTYRARRFPIPGLGVEFVQTHLTEPESGIKSTN